MIQPLGDRAFLLEWDRASTFSPSVITAAAKRIRQLDLPWVQDAVPAFRTLAVYIRPKGYPLEQFSQELVDALGDISLDDSCSSRQVEIPVFYGGEDGPDLAACAARSGLTERQFADRHAEAAYQVAMIGFAPGFPYMSGLPESLAQPRHNSPRLQVPAGSVGIAGGQTGVYSVSSPGGWQIIGRTPLRLFRPDSDRPFLLAPGDTVKFVPIERQGEQMGGSGNVTHKGTDSSAPSSASGSQPALTVLKPGLLTTIQDLGRFGWQAYGVSVGGAMDEVSMRRANLLIGNREDAAVLELTLTGGSFRTERGLLAAICGADLGPTADGEPLPMNRPVWLNKGVILSFGRAVAGCRAYLALSGGIAAPLVLASRSTDIRAGIGGVTGRSLAQGDVLRCEQPSALSLQLGSILNQFAIKKTWRTSSWSAAIVPIQRLDNLTPIRVVPGAEWEQFVPESRQRLIGEPYRVEASSDRMGLRLSGTRLSRHIREELLSHGVAPGTVQVPPNGQPIVLAAGCQPTGGYPKIAHVITADLPILAQAVPGDRILFVRTAPEVAEQAMRERERELALLRAGIQAKVLA